jgi:penicillin amidase/acyl-homoserine-lactone acylase
MRWVLGASSALILMVAGAVYAGLGLAPLTATGDPGAIRTAAAQYDARIERDDFGVPHISGARDADVAFGVGYAHSEDDFATLAEVVTAVRGRLAETKGKGAAVGDYLIRQLRVWETVEAAYETDIAPEVRAILEAYAAGVNLYAVEHPDATPKAMLPVTGRDLAAGFVFRTPFFYGLEGTLKALTAAAPASPAVTPAQPAVTPKGSNGVAVAPSRSADGATRLLVNSHQPYTGPVAWWEAVLDSGEGWHVAGGFFPGSPFMLHGHNAHLGWANTVNKPDLVDIYKLETDPAKPGQYRLDGAWRPLEKSVAKLRVRVFGPFTWTVKRDVLYSAHGPVIVTPRGTFALRYAGMGEMRLPTQYYRLNKARDLAEWQAAMSLLALPSINFVYADEKGNIGYVYNARFPVRTDGVDWSGTLPGDRSDLIWTQALPFEQVPQIWNPPSGFVFNANNTPFRATDPAYDIAPASVSPLMGVQTNMTNRAYRALETFGADASITAEEFDAYKYDLAYSPSSVMAARVRELIALDAQGDADLAAAQQALAAWDLRTNVDNRQAALAVLTIAPIVGAIDDGETPPDLRAALKQTIVLLKTHFGRIDPQWGEVNRLRRGELDIAVDGGPDILRAVYGKPQADGRLTGAAGDTLIMFVEWDRTGKLSSRSIHQFGAATLDATSPHYADQAKLFASMQTKPVLFTRAELAGHVKRDYRPGRSAPAPSP